MRSRDAVQDSHVTHCRRRSGNGLPVDMRTAASTPRHTATGSGWRLSRQGFGWRQIGVVGIAVGEMSKWREEVVRALTPDGADDISGFASDGVGAFRKRKIAVGCSAQQRGEIRADIIGNTHGGTPK